MRWWITHLGGAPSTVGIPTALWLAGGHLAVAGRTALVANAMSHVAVQILKRTVARARPCDPNGIPLAEIAIPDPFSFPSGHSAASMAVALSLALAHPWLAPVALPMAGAICYSRVRLRVHHRTDVVAGAALGIAGALAARGLLG
jgi:undecaprenyl-diphosphatase